MLDKLERTKSDSEGALSEHSVSLIKNWIGSCQKDHGEAGVCPRDIRPTILPTRVIDVGSESCEPHLFVTNGAHGAYVALSHCWGEVTRTTTFRNNFRSRVEAIPLTTMSPTFRDAVIVTRALGVRYLWIDSLCIIQDSDEDWARESAKMAQVYKNSFVAIAASSSADSQQGFLHVRPQEPTYCQLSENLGTVFCIREPRRFRDEKVQWPLEPRAWVVQERELSPRMIHFGFDQIFWSCKGGWKAALPETDCDTFGDVHEYVERRVDKEDIGGMYRTRIADINWDSLVDLYSTKRLTYPSDKLPALSGVAEVVAGVSGDEYLAGLWKSDLLCGLLWKRRNADPRFGVRDDLHRVTPPRAPSWSWAAFDGAVETHKPFWITGIGEESQDLAKLESYKVELVDQRYPLGKVRHGQLTLIAPTKVIAMDIFQSCHNFHPTPSHHTPSLHQRWIQIQEGDRWKLSKKIRSIDFDIDLEIHNTPEDNFTCALLQLYPEEYGMSEYSNIVYGLLLKPIASTRDTFERVGIFRIDCEGDEAGSWPIRSLTII